MTWLLPPGTLRFPWGNPSRDEAPFLQDCLVWRASNTSCHSSLLRYQTSLVSSTWGMDAWASDSPSFRLGMLGRGQTPLPYTGHAFKHQLGGCFSWWHTLSPAYPLGVGYRAWLACPCQTLAAVRWHVMTIILVLCWNARTASVSEAGTHLLGAPGQT